MGIGPNYDLNNPAVLFSNDDMVIRTGGTNVAGYPNNGQMDIAASEVLNIGLAANLVDAVNITTYSSYIQFPYGGNTINVIAGTNYLTVDATTGLTYNGNAISATANTGNVTFNDVNIIGTGHLYLQPDPANVGANLDIYLSTPGPDIHIAAVNDNIIIGSDTGANVEVGLNGNVTIQAWNGTANTWTFDNTGTLSAPGNIIAGNLATSGSGGNITGANVISAVTVSVTGTITANTFQTNGNLYIGDLGIAPGSAIVNQGNTFLVYAQGVNAIASMGWAESIFSPGPVARIDFNASGNDGNVVISTGNSGTPNNWTFDLTGNLTAPNRIGANAVILKNTDDFAQILFSSDGGTTNNGQIKVDGGTNMIISAASNFYVKQNGSDRIAVTDTTSDFMAATNVRIQSNKTGTANTWTFDNTGNLTLPSNTWQVNYANGTPVNIGGGTANIGNFIFDSYSLDSTTFDEITVGEGSSGNILINGPTLAMVLAGGDSDGLVAGGGNVYIFNNDPTFIDGIPQPGVGQTWQFDNTGNLIVPGNVLFTNSAGQIYGNDTIAIGNATGDNQVYISNTIIGLQTYNGNTYSTWQFDTSGNLAVPGNSTISTLNATGGLGGNSITITAGAADGGTYSTSPGGNLILQGGGGAFNDGGGGGPGGSVNINAGLSSDPAGHAGNVTVNSGSNTWNFDYNGNLTVPAQNNAQQVVRGTTQTIIGDPYPAGSIGSTANVTVWTADSDIVSAAEMTLRVVYYDTGLSSWQNTEIIKLMMAKTYPGGEPVLTVTNRLKTNPAYTNTLVDVALTGNALQVISSAPDGVGNNVYWTYNVSSFNQTFD
jgi:hypothetical protein